MNDDVLKSIDRTLKAMLGILISTRTENQVALQERIRRLHDLGFKPKEIGDIIGRTGTYVNKEISLIRKAKGKGKT